MIFGDAAALAEAARRSDVEPHWQVAPSGEAGVVGPEAPVVVDVGGVAPELLFAGRATAEGGSASYRFITEALDAIRQGHADALVTAPISKEALGLAGLRFAGHTDFLAETLEAPHAVMMLAGGPLRVALVTHHMALADVPAALTCDGIVDVARVTHDALRRYWGIAEPRLAVCGLNPHASDGGRFGHEEAQIVGPAIDALHHAGIAAHGPVAPDTCFLRATRGEFDGVVALYHDQGLIPLKLLAFDEAVNVTLGLPIVRTSPDHGTAYDIAGQGVASPVSMIAAIRLAVRMCHAERAGG
jgi:4-hydroxythreonine-4-phosphate dehydrogenase